MLCMSIRLAVAGDNFFESHAGILVMRARITGKCLKVMMVGREAAIARTIGARKFGTESASTDVAKQNVVVVSIAQQRMPKNRSDDWLELFFWVRTLQQRLI